MLLISSIYSNSFTEIIDNDDFINRWLDQNVYSSDLIEIEEMTLEKPETDLESNFVPELPYNIVVDNNNSSGETEFVVKVRSSLSEKSVEITNEGILTVK